ncbi:hypothetical protein GL263_26435 [Streptomyces durbertensis]|uniref:Uncharacterized protein n=2 Tax=Streptomyces durbertensis TaxID=2448886 RepID=A0ABR6EP86_9ACTN|nr:hypothetical protein [Streptomyces durbertensis]
MAKKGVAEDVPGVGETRRWFGESKGERVSDPSFTVSARTDARGRLLSLACNAAGVEPGAPAMQVAVFSDCVNGAELRGVDAGAVSAWVAKTLPTMLGKGGVQVADTRIGGVEVRVNTAGDTAAIEVRAG